MLRFKFVTVRAIWFAGCYNGKYRIRGRQMTSNIFFVGGSELHLKGSYEIRIHFPKKKREILFIKQLTQHIINCSFIFLHFSSQGLQHHMQPTLVEPFAAAVPLKNQTKKEKRINTEQKVQLLLPSPAFFF